MTPAAALLAALLAAAPAAADEPVLGGFRRADAARERAAKLGAQLFFDTRLSGNGAVSCAQCHNPALAWSDGQTRSLGVGHAPSRRNAPSLLGAARRKSFHWDGRWPTLEKAVAEALRSPDEMAAEPAQVLRTLDAVPEYARAFEEAFGRPGIALRDVVAALAAFIEDGIPRGPSRFELWRAGRGSLTAAERRGQALFAGKAGCVRCHAGDELTDGSLRAIGLKPDAASGEAGRAFRTPSLLDAGLTAPYMHDGSLRSLADVVEFYDRGGDEAGGRDPGIAPLGLTPHERRELVAFLETLSGELPPFELPSLPAPWGPLSLREGVLGGAKRVSLIEAALRRGELASAGAAARNLADEVGVLKRLEAQAVERRRLAGCLEELSSAARTLASSLEAGRPGSAARLREAQGRCERLLGPALAPSAPDADAALTEAESALRTLDAAGARPRMRACVESFSVPGLLAELRRGDDELRAAAARDLAGWHRLRALAARDPGACAPLAGLEHRPSDALHLEPGACRAWYWDAVASRALAQGGEPFEPLCLRAASEGAWGLSAADGARLCPRIARGASRPERLCAELAAEGRLNETEAACVLRFARALQAPAAGPPEPAAAVEARLARSACELRARRDERRARERALSAVGDAERILRAIDADPGSPLRPRLERLRRRVGS